jgi:hypothetical protein
MNYLILAAGLALLGVAHAGHEFPFYPSFYPQEITIEALDARSAALCGRNVRSAAVY